MSYDPQVGLAQEHADELFKIELPFIILLVIIAAVLISVMLARKQEDKNLFENLWEGNLGLAMTYWVYGLLGGIVWAVGIASINPAPEGNLVILIWLFFTCYYIVTYVGIWNAANKFDGNKTWSILAKFAVIVVALTNVIQFIKWFSAG